MSRKDFELIATVLRESRIGRDSEHDATINSLAYVFASRLYQANPRFNTDKFLRAAGVPK